MGGSSRVSGPIMDRKRATTDDGEPLLVHNRSVIDHDGTLYSNVPADGAAILGISAADEIAVAVYEDHLEIRPKDDE